MSKIKGGDLMLFVNNKSIAYATNHTLEISAELKDVSNKDEGAGDWSSQEVGLLSWNASTENLYSLDGAGNNFAALYDLMIAKTPTLAYFTVKSQTGNTVPTGGWSPKAAATGNPQYKGNVVLNSLQLTAQNGDYAQFTAQFTGVGPLNKVTT